MQVEHDETPHTHLGDVSIDEDRNLSESGIHAAFDDRAASSAPAPVHVLDPAVPSPEAIPNPEGAVAWGAGGTVLLPSSALSHVQRVHVRNALAMELLWTRQAIDSRLQVSASAAVAHGSFSASSASSCEHECLFLMLSSLALAAHEPWPSLFHGASLVLHALAGERRTVQRNNLFNQ